MAMGKTIYDNERANYDDALECFNNAYDDALECYN